MTYALTTEWVDIDTLRPHPRNPRNGDIDAIAESIQVNNLYRPIVVTTDGTILAGNHTYMAAMGLGLASMPVVRLPLDPDSDEARRIMLADNRTADRGMYDDGLLLDLLRDTPLEGTGYDERDLIALLHEDPAPDPPESPLVVVTLLLQPETRDQWRDHRDGFSTDTAALKALL